MSVIIWFMGSTPGNHDDGLVIEGTLDELVDQIKGDDEWISVKRPNSGDMDIRRDQIIAVSETPEPFVS